MNYIQSVNRCQFANLDRDNLHRVHIEHLEHKYKFLEAELIQSASQITDLIQDAEWDFISQCLYLSPGFIEEHAETLKWQLLGYNQIIPDNLIIKFITKIEPLTLLEGQSSLNREPIKGKALELVLAKLKNAFNNEKINGWLHNDIGKFTDGANKMYNFVIDRHPRRSEFELCLQNRTSITTENICDDIHSTCSADTIFDLEYDLKWTEKYLGNATILDKFFYE